MDTTEEAVFLDTRGDPRSDQWPAWLTWMARRRGWIGSRGGVSVSRIAEDTGYSQRTVERWLARSRTPDLGVRRTLRRAWAAPTESEAMRHLEAAFRALQGPSVGHDNKGGGGRVALASVVDPPVPSNPGPPPPASPSPAALAAALARARAHKE